MDLNPYLTFPGTCAEALDFYADALGGEVIFTQRFSEMPGGTEMAKDAPDRIAHARLKIGDKQVMASDQPPGMPFDGHSGFNMQLGFTSTDAARAAFDRLAEGGEIRMPFEATFWAKGFGMLTDRFGVPWMINCDDETP